MANLQVILTQTQASHAAALTQAHDAHAATLQQAHATHQEEIRQALEQANIAHNAALEQARAQHIQTLEQTNATHHQQLQQALEQTRAGHIQETQQKLEQLQSSHAAALENAKAEYESKLAAAKTEHENSLAQHQQQIQTVKSREQQLEEQLRQAQQAGGGGDPQQITSLKEENLRLRQQILQGGGNPPPPPVEAILAGVPLLNNVQNFLHNIPPVVVDPQLDINKNNFIVAIRGGDPNVMGGLLGTLMARLTLPQGDPQRINVSPSKRNGIRQDFEEIRGALANPNNIDWESVSDLYKKLVEGQDAVGGGGIMVALKRYYELASGGGQTFTDLTTNLKGLLDLKNEIDSALTGNAKRQEQEDLRNLILQSDQELQANAVPHAQVLNILSDKVTEIYGMLPQLTALIDQIEQNIQDYMNVQPDPLPVSPRSFKAKESLTKLITYIKTYNMEEVSKFLFKGIQQGLSPMIANNLFMLDDIRIGLLMSNSPLFNFRGKIPVARTAFEDLVERVKEFNDIFNAQDKKVQDIFIARDNSARFIQLKQQIAAAIPDLGNAPMNQKLNRILPLDPFSMVDGNERNEYAKDIREIKKFVTLIVDNDQPDPVLIQAVSPVYSLCNLFDNIIEAANKMAHQHNPAPQP